MPTYREMGLTDSEYQKILDILGREPSLTELGMFAVLWSEHCGYKHSRPYFHHFPTTGERILVGPGENAGVVDIGDGLAVSFKLESHNHPVAVEPYQGAATGSGGIIRDILSMGARPIAVLDSLRFGPLDDDRQRYLFGGVVAGVGGYGNCVGVPTVGGEVLFEESYRHNPLCNVMCVGLMSKDRLTFGKAAGIGNKVILVGATTGRDGIHGATFASEDLGEESEAKRPNVQVGDPFMEKLLIEGCLELIERGLVVGIQDMGAAGITSSTAETAHRAGSGVEIEIQRVPMREEGMNAYEVMLSESQERMLVIAEPEKVPEVEDVCRRWGLECAVLGEVTGTGRLVVRDGGKVEADVPVSALAEAPVKRVEEIRPGYLDIVNSGDFPEDVREGLDDVLLRLLSAPNIADKEWVYGSYDYQVQTRTVLVPGAGDAAVLRVRGTSRGLALTTDGNGRYVYLDPGKGASMVVAEAARNVVAVGARPVAITDCLNFGNPEKGEVAWQFSEAVQGISEACRVLGTPVTGGNVSFYNETGAGPIYPTPVIGMLGLLDDIEKRLTPASRSKGDVMILLGPRGSGIGGSEYLKTIHGLVRGPLPELDLEMEKKTADLLLAAAGKGLLLSAHDVGDGGLLTAAAEMAILSGPGRDGVDLTLESGGMRYDELLFGESGSRYLVTVSEERAGDLLALAREAGVPAEIIGKVSEEVFRVEVDGRRVVERATADLTRAHRLAIPAIMEKGGNG